MPTSPRLENMHAVSISFQARGLDAHEDPQYLLLCVNTKNSTALVHVEVGSLSSDQYLFHHIPQEYQRVRSEHEWRISLLIPSWIHKLLHSISARLPKLPSSPARILFLPIISNALAKLHLHKIVSGDFVQVGTHSLHCALLVTKALFKLTLLNSSI